MLEESQLENEVIRGAKQGFEDAIDYSLHMNTRPLTDHIKSAETALKTAQDQKQRWYYTAYVAAFKNSTGVAILPPGKKYCRAHPQDFAGHWDCPICYTLEKFNKEKKEDIQ